MKPILTRFWQARWLTAARAQKAWAYSAAFLIFLLALRSSVDFRAPLLTGAKPPSMDFVVFWSAGREVLAGNPAGAYQRAPMLALQANSVNITKDQYYPFFYPPFLLPLCAILAFPPYIMGLLAYALAQMAGFALVMRRLLPVNWPRSLLILAPGMLVSASVGQLGSLLAMLFATGIILIEQKPFWAGAALAMLGIKPHLALLPPLVLLAARQWRALCGAICAVAAAIALSAAWYGVPTWFGFIEAVQGAARFQQDSIQVYPKMASVFTAVWFCGHHVGLAYAAQAVVAAIVFVSVIKLSYSTGPRAGLVLASVATPLISPHVFDYDLAVTLPGVAALALMAAGTGWRNGEKLACIAVFAIPVLARPLGILLGVGAAPLCLALLSALLYRRLGRQRAQNE